MTEREQHLEAIRLLAAAAEANDPAIRKHIERVSALSRQLALHLWLRPEEADEIARAAMLHDIGKIWLPERIVNKLGELSPEEWLEMRKHPIYGEEVLALYRERMLWPGQEFDLARQIVRWHHERWDGSGYPDGLRGEAIPLAARVVAVTDAYDAMAVGRSGKRARAPDEAMAEMARLGGLYYDPRVVQALAELFESGLLDALLGGSGGIRRR